MTSNFVPGSTFPVGTTTVIYTATDVSSNTSTIPLKHLMEGLSEEFSKHFIITHFFNPPRYMRLLELVVEPE